MIGIFAQNIFKLRLEAIQYILYCPARTFVLGSKLLHHTMQFKITIIHA